MANQKKSEKITIANLVSIVGVVLLLAFTFLGYYYKSGGELGLVIVKACGIAALTVLLLWLLIKAKGAENSIEKWKVVEFVTLFVYIAIALWTSISGGLMHFFVINSNKESIKQYAKQDLNRIDSLFIEYKNFEGDAISTTGIGLANATTPGQRSDSELTTFLQANHIEGLSGARNFESIQRGFLLGDSFTNYYNRFLQDKAEIESVVESWSIIMVPSKAKQIEDIAKDVAITLTNLSNNAKLPVIVYDRSIAKYTISEQSQVKDFSEDIIDPNDGTISQDVLRFKNALIESDGFSLFAFILALAIHALVLFNYFVAYRTKKTMLTNNDSGRTL